MTKVTEAIYANGVLKPVDSLDLPEQQRVRLTLEPIDRPCGEERQMAFRRFLESVDNGSFYLMGQLPTRA